MVKRQSDGQEPKGPRFGKNPDEIRTSGRLRYMTEGEAKVYLALNSQRHDGTALVRTSRAQLAEDTGFTTRGVSKCLRGLEELGVVEIEKEEEGDRRENLYRLPVEDFPDLSDKTKEERKNRGTRVHLSRKNRGTRVPRKGNQGSEKGEPPFQIGEPRFPSPSTFRDIRDTESFQREPDPLSDGGSAPAGISAASKAEEGEEDSTARGQELATPPEEAEELSEQDQETLACAVSHFRGVQESQGIFRVYTQLLDLPLDPPFTAMILDRAAATVRREKGWAVA